MKSLNMITSLLVLGLCGCGGGASGTDVFDAPQSDIGVDPGQADSDAGTDVPTGPILSWSPTIIDFDYVPYSDVKTVDLTLSNVGNDTLFLLKDNVRIAPASPDYEHIHILVEGGTAKTFPAEEMFLEPDDSLTVKLQWKALSPVGNKGDPIGHLLIASSDDTQDFINVKILGRVDSPILQLSSDAIDFGSVGPMVTAERPLSLLNQGTGELVINESGGCLEILGDEDDGFPGEFGFKKAGGFAPTDITNCGPGYILDSKGSTVTLTFTNQAPGTDSAEATLKFTSNAPNATTVEVPLTAKRAETATCEPVLVPSKLDFGVVPKGFFKEMTFELLNEGPGYCSFVNATIEDCSGMMGMMVSCSEPGTGFDSANYVYTGLPPAAMNGIGPGEHVPLTVRFTPPPEESVFGMLMTYPALASMRLHDSQLQKKILLPPSDGGGGIPGLGGWSPNLDGDSGMAKISILPAQVDFGLTTIGCFSRTFEVCVHNKGSASLTISGISMEDCSPEFKKKNFPPMPKDISMAVGMCFEMVYSPTDEGSDLCHVQIESTDSWVPLVSVKLEGEGTIETEQTDIFTQVSGQEVDILVVIDDSGSMCLQQDKLVASLPSYIQHLEQWNSDFHIGVITVNVLDYAVSGMLNYGDPSKPRFLTSETPDLESAFAEIVDIGCNGGPNCGAEGPCTGNQEAGLEASQLALSSPHSSETGVSCVSDSQCHNNSLVCPDPGACSYIFCLDGTCGGWNKGFLRKEARLEIIVLSDEEDQSAADVFFYIDFLQQLKGFYNVQMTHFNAIVGQSPSTCGEASPGKRYIKVAKETNGKVGDICESSYDPIMNEIGSQVFGAKVQFFLTQIANPATIGIWINDVACDSGWIHDAPSNSVVFDEIGSCMPAQGDEIKIDYDVLCLEE